MPLSPVGRNAVAADPHNVAARFLALKTAGIIQHVKDTSAKDAGDWWAWPSNRVVDQRDIVSDFRYDPKQLLPLAKSLRAALIALGHASSAYTEFTKLKSRNISPDGSLGGKGYVAKIPEMRRQLVNCVEALSSFTDTVYDEILAPHWHTAAQEITPQEKSEFGEVVENARVIRQDPEGWASQEQAEDDFEEEIPEGPHPDYSGFSSGEPRNPMSAPTRLAARHLRNMARLRKDH